MKRLKIVNKALSLVLALAFCVPANVSADSAFVEKEIEEANRKNVAGYAVSFVEKVFGSSNLDVGEVITFLDENNELSGYCVDLEDDGMPNGYVIVKFSDNQPVVSEFCVESGAENPYKEIMKQSNINEDEVKAYYSIGPNDYHVYAPEKNIVCGYGD